MGGIEGGRGRSGGGIEGREGVGGIEGGRGGSGGGIEGREGVGGRVLGFRSNQRI